MQMDARREFATRRGWIAVATVEEIASGAKDDRPKRQEVLKAARQPQVDVIIVWKLDRWGRSLVDLMATLQELTKLGVGFVSLTEALDLTTPAGRAFAGFLAVFAEFERDLIRERIKAGIHDARKRGKAHGRPRAQANNAEQIRAQPAQGLSQAAIAKRLGIWRTSVRRVLAVGGEGGTPERAAERVKVFGRD
jgi:putative DNA-invertase from lambdoid prophage Rac